MKVKDLYPLMQGTVAIYRRLEHEEDPMFEDMYKGDKYQIPKNLLEKEIMVISGARKSVLDIQVEA